VIYSGTMKGQSKTTTYLGKTLVSRDIPSQYKEVKRNAKS